MKSWVQFLMTSNFKKFLNEAHFLKSWPRLQFSASWKFSFFLSIFVLIFCWFFCSFHIMMSWVQSLVISLILDSFFIGFFTILHPRTQHTKCWKLVRYFHLLFIIIHTLILKAFRGSFGESLCVIFFWLYSAKNYHFIQKHYTNRFHESYIKAK